METKPTTEHGNIELTEDQAKVAVDMEIKTAIDCDWDFPTNSCCRSS